MPKKTRKSGGRVISVDFSGTQEGSFKKVPDGEYLVKVADVTQEEGQNSGQPYLKWVFEIIENPKLNGAKLWHNTSLQPQALFNLRSTLEAMDVPVPDSIVNLNLDDYIGLELAVGVENELYEGKKKPKIVDLFSTADFFGEDEEEEDEEDEEDEEEEDEDEDLAYEDMTLAELKDLCEEREIEVPKKAKAKKLIALLEEYDEEEEV